MSEIKKIDSSEFAKMRLDSMDRALLEQADAIAPIESLQDPELSTVMEDYTNPTPDSKVYKFSESEISNSDTETDNSGLWQDVREEATGATIDLSADIARDRLAGLWQVKGLNISFAEALAIGRFATRVIPIVSAVIEPAYEAFKYTVLEGEGAEGIINHKYELTGAAVGGIATGAIMAVVLASNPAGWVVLGAAALCAVGSFALENIGAYYDSADAMPVDYMSNVYFY